MHSIFVSWIEKRNLFEFCGMGQRPAIVVVASLEALPRGPGFDPPRGRISALGLKKLPRLSHVQSTVEPGLTHKATGPRVRVGQGFGGFLGLLWEGYSTSQTMSWRRSHPRKSSFLTRRQGLCNNSRKIASNFCGHATPTGNINHKCNHPAKMARKKRSKHFMKMRHHPVNTPKGNTLPVSRSFMGTII